nr:putative lysozyme-like protein isoform X1 [Drosophila suzukii]XP_016928961.1 putative lysozyme-like protein isoform X1 [Drosophila suzukii]XP_016928962.1 putative lysozyme-like protein isoform X1 [Drosophila suzukii]
MAQTMDDMVFQCSNQNSIYVLNASYGAYGDYGTYAATKREINGSRSRAANPIEATCSSGVLQHKFKTFGSAAAAAAAAAATATATTATTMPMDAASNYVNPVATSMSTAMCSPATAALQKLFNCSVGVACQNVTHAHSNHNSSSNIHGSNINGSNNNAAASNHNNRCLSAAGGVTQNGRNRSRSGESLDGTAGVVTPTGGGAGAGAGGAATGGHLPLLPKKKCTNVKSALIAKKTKFLKYLEEEKWRSNAAASEDSAGAISSAPHSSGNNNGGNLKNQSNSQEAGSAANAANAGNAGTGGSGGQLNKLTNWSMHNEDNNTAALTGQQLKQHLQQQRPKSSFELYQEAADILGLSCSLCDNCRCLDCQSGYFDCDDDDESYSEQSLMDDEYEDEFDCSAEELQAVLTGGGHGGGGAGGGGVPIPPCCQLEASSHLPHKRDSPDAHTALPDVESLGHRLAIDFDLINATCSQVLENCETFNDLSLLDAGVERPFT